MAPVHLIEDSSVVDPVLDAAISRALMLRVAAGEMPDTLRISRPGPSIAFGKRDVISPGYADAVTAAQAGGFNAIERLAGGRAAVFHEDTLHFSQSIHSTDPRTGVTRRFEDTAALISRAFRGFGIDAHVGEIEGEYCPGAHSVNARHRTKLMGIGQRVIHNGAHIAGVIVVDGADRIRDILTPVYAALDLPWNPATAGSLNNELPTITWDQVADGVKAQYARLHDMELATLGDETLALAERLAPEHASTSP